MSTDPMMPPPPSTVPVRPGWWTSEFWAHLITPAVMVLGVFGVVVPPTWVEAALAVASAGASIGYSMSRSKVKVAQIEAATATITRVVPVQVVGGGG
jgi:hypothetical protein